MEPMRVPTWINRTILAIALAVAAGVGWTAHEYGWDCVAAGGALYQDGPTPCTEPDPGYLMP